MKHPSIIPKVRDVKSPKDPSRSLTQEEVAEWAQQGRDTSFTRSELNRAMKRKTFLPTWLLNRMETELGVPKSWLTTGNGYFSLLATVDPLLAEHHHHLISCLQHPDTDGAILEILAPEPGYASYLAGLAQSLGGHPLAFLESEVHRTLVSRVSERQQVTFSEEERWAVITALSKAVSCSTRHRDILAALTTRIGGHMVQHDKFLKAAADHEAWRIFCLLRGSWWPLAAASGPHPRLSKVNLHDYLMRLLALPENAALQPADVQEWTQRVGQIWTRITDQRETYEFNALERLVLATALVPSLHPDMGYQAQWLPMASALAQIGFSPLPPIFPAIDMASPLGGLKVLRGDFG
jgi:hypothetical protein